MEFKTFLEANKFTTLFNVVVYDEKKQRRDLEVKTEERADGIYTDVIAFFYDDEIDTHNNRREREYEIKRWATPEAAVAGHKFIFDELKSGTSFKDMKAKVVNM